MGAEGRSTGDCSSLVNTIIRDLRFALRMLVKYPGFSIAAIVTLGLGIGANSAIFSVVDAVMFNGLPYDNPEQVVTVYGTDLEDRFGVSEMERLRYIDETDVFASVAAYATGAMTITGQGDADLLPAAFVNANLFSTLGRAPLRGRTFSPEEDAPGPSAVVVVSYGLWQQLGGIDDVVGSNIVVNGRARTVIGVLPQDFRLPTDYQQSTASIYFPLGLNPSPDPRNLHYLNVAARLADGVGPAQAQTAMVTVSERLREEIGTLPPTFIAAVVPMQQELFGDVSQTLVVLLVAVGLVLLIACVNVASLLLARGEARARELAIRTALGAGRKRLVRQLLTESVVLGAIGGGLGLLLAMWAVQALVSLNPPGLPRIDEVLVDGRVIAFTFGVALLTSVLFGLAPAFQSAHVDEQGLREGSVRTTAGRQGLRLRRALVVTEVAVGLMLTIGAGLLIRSFAELQSVGPGFASERVMTMRSWLPGSRYPDKPAVRDFYREALTKIRALPGVTNAGAISQLPMASTPGDWGVRLEGREEERLASGRRPWADWIVVTDGYFETMGIALRQGRFTDATDRETSIPTAVINETMAARYWPDGSALGSRFKLSSNIDTLYRTVVGIVADVKHNGLDSQTRPQMFLPHGQFPATASFTMSTMSLALVTTGDPEAITGAVRQALRSIDPDIPIAQVATMENVVKGSTSMRRLNVWLFSGFGMLALVLVTVGVYGVMAYSVTQRSREIGIRMALGASPQTVRGEIVRQGVTLTAFGIGAGLVGALALSHLLSGLLFGIGARDPITFIVIPLLLAAIGTLACYVPARHATTVDPATTLRDA